MARWVLRVANGERRDAQTSGGLRFRMDDVGDADAEGEEPFLGAVLQQVFQFSPGLEDFLGVGERQLARLGQLEAAPDAMVIVDADGRVGIDWGVYGVPETFVIDKAGVIRYKHIGPVTPEAMEQKILPLMKELNK